MVALPFSHPAPTQQQPQPPASRSEVYNIQPATNANSTLLERIAIEDLEGLRDSLVKMLSGYAWGKRSNSSEQEGKFLKKFADKKEDWIPIFPLSIHPITDQKGKVVMKSELDRYLAGDYPTIGQMPLREALYITEQITNMLNATGGTTWYNPETTNTVEMARIIALNSTFLMDNPLREYTGNEADMSYIGLFIMKEMLNILNRSLGGFFVNKLTESTTNIYKRDVSSDPSAGMVKRKQSQTEKFLSNMR